MNARQTAVGLLAAVALAASAGTAQAGPIRDGVPKNGTVSDVRTDSLLHHLRLQYADTHQRSVHNELVLILNVPASAVL
ncbi:hypothetical protein FHX52_2579 [Humibacillus xanthopallidus]|uniref:Uncharacterized protein n=1 Tax=Humibacillus xanthopallidus TaxID=412689 RepID=A0A543PPB5_9MICO|nr:hypothetical protein [Humibacillus xanthopallidus]TQN45877.1 hypothetical protein FHX52_2579 [Humibacillus xanthopallidus]